MKVVHIELNQIYELESNAACIGYFDGMHKGHLELVNQAIQRANELNIKSACITFEPDPWVIIKGMKDIPHITSMKERIEIGQQCGLDYWIIVSFTKELANLSCEAFEQMLSNMNVKSLICGFDYTYGEKGKGNVESLKKQTMFEVIEVDAVLYKDEKISSTRIEANIEKGAMQEVLQLLGRPYSIKGTIKKGSSLGKTIGYPTANLLMNYHYVMPSIGVYIGYAYVKNKHYKCMMNVGHNPTFNYQEKISVEAFLLDFDDNLYDDEMELIFIEKIRDEKKFSSKEQLIQQLNLDVLKAKKL